MHLARTGSIDQTIPLSQSRNNRHKKHCRQHRPKVNCQIGFHLLINPSHNPLDNSDGADSVPVGCSRKFAYFPTKQQLMRAFGRVFQPQGVLAFAKFFANKVLFSNNTFVVRTPQTQGHTKCPFSIDNWCVRAFRREIHRIEGCSLHQ